MKCKTKIITLCLLVVLALSAAVPAKAASGPKLSAAKLTLSVGETKKLSVKNNSQKVIWSSSKKSVATVSKEGTVKGVKAGKAVIQAKIAKKVLKCSVIVTEKTRSEAEQRIVDFTNRVLGSVVQKKDIKFETVDGDMYISIAFYPSVGSFPVKSEIYEDIAYHALQVTMFYPEVKKLTYIVLWNFDGKKRNTAMTLTIEEDEIEQLSKLYYGPKTIENGGFQPTYEDIFSSIEETEESKTWRMVLDPNAPLP